MFHPITEENLESVLEDGGISMDDARQMFSEKELQDMIEEANRLGQLPGKQEAQYYLRSWINQAIHEGACETAEARHTTDWDWNRD